MKMDFHEAADIFPLDEEHIAELSDDIKAHGLKTPIQRLGGKILDGRRRYLACQSAGVEPSFIDVEVDNPIAHVLSLNLKRRHLTEAQRAMIADKCREFYAAEARKRQQASGGDKKSEDAKSVVEPVPQPIGKGGRSRDEAGAAVGVSGRSVDFARQVRRDGVPALVSAVETGQVGLKPAVKISKLPKREQPAADVDVQTFEQDPTTAPAPLVDDDREEDWNEPGDFWWPTPWGIVKRAAAIRCEWSERERKRRWIRGGPLPPRAGEPE